jgi:hypothetical protein
MIFVLAGMIIISLWMFNFPVFSGQAKKSASSSRLQIVISNLKISPVNSHECEVDLMLLATYKHFKSGPKPKLLYRIICGKESAPATIELLDVKTKQSSININRRFTLAPWHRCSGKCKFLFWMEDGGVKSNELTDTCEFKI